MLHKENNFLILKAQGQISTQNKDLLSLENTVLWKTNCYDHLFCGLRVQTLHQSDFETQIGSGPLEGGLEQSLVTIILKEAGNEQNQPGRNITKGRVSQLSINYFEIIFYNLASFLFINQLLDLTVITSNKKLKTPVMTSLSSLVVYSTNEILWHQISWKRKVFSVIFSEDGFYMVQFKATSAVIIFINYK